MKLLVPFLLIFLSLTIYGEDKAKTDCVFIWGNFGNHLPLYNDSKQYKIYKEMYLDYKLLQVDSLFTHSNLSSDPNFKSKVITYKLARWFKPGGYFYGDGEEVSIDRVLPPLYLDSLSRYKPMKITSQVIFYTGLSTLDIGASLSLMGIFLAAMGDDNLLVVGGITSIVGGSLMIVSIPFHLTRKPKKTVMQNLVDYNYKLTVDRLNLDCNRSNYIDR